MTDSKYLIEFDSAEAAERAAWMLQGEWVNQTQVWVPSHNLNPLSIDAVASMVSSSWRLAGTDFGCRLNQSAELLLNSEFEATHGVIFGCTGAGKSILVVADRLLEMRRAEEPVTVLDFPPPEND